jgi:hypothetical protein
MPRVRDGDGGTEGDARDVPADGGERGQRVDIVHLPEPDRLEPRRSGGVCLAEQVVDRVRAIGGWHAEGKSDWEHVGHNSSIIPDYQTFC